MAELFGYFALIWAIGVPVFIVMWRISQKWPSFLRLSTRSFGIAVTIAPGAIVGHGFAIVPAVMAIYFYGVDRPDLVLLLWGAPAIYDLGRGRLKLLPEGNFQPSLTSTMRDKKSKLYQDMPVAGRLIAGSIGLFLAAGSVGVLLTVRPLNWKAIGLSVAGFGLGADLLCSALRGRWPFSALIWLEMNLGQ